MGEDETVKRGFILFPERDPYNRPFTEIVDYAKRQGFSVVRLDLLDKQDDFDSEKCKGLIYKAVEALEEDGCNYIGVRGESLGSEMLMEYPGKEKFDFMILWCPTNRLGTRPGNHKISGFDKPVKILHGSEDQEADIERSKELAQAFPKAKFSKIEGKGHELGSKAVSRSESMFLASRM